MYPRTKVQILRAMIRDAITDQNKRWKFSCYDCVCCVPIDPRDRGSARECNAGFLDRPSKTLMPAHMVMACFQFGQHNGAFGPVVAWMILNGFDIMNDEYGWGTVLQRIVRRSNKCGHFLNVNPRNLRRFV